MAYAIEGLTSIMRSSEITITQQQNFKPISHAINII